MTGGSRTLAACLASIEAEQQERPLDLTQFVGEEIHAVEPHAHGWRLRVGSGASFVVERGHTFDAAGAPVIEP